eukprot:CAMPEP_0118878430 /NCGR_PEP_ID=MMETSP1163-20130328/18334_1 /TAXON_ID=124430 /ORGANISM="Phaeomonas parva, Strain CCMP2877" /LENGTH=217 /DNA_ID=CAMNT_0006814255 /DNA_START=173 /DNA_END=826 /DNA_ORIENTATION=+
MATEHPLQVYLKTLTPAPSAPERAEELGRLADYIAGKVAAGAPPKLNFICTHNSRRSHMGAIAAAGAGVAYSVPGLETFSGGTSATAFFPAAVAAVEKAGCGVSVVGYEDAEQTNPTYEVDFGGAAPMTCFSKVYDDFANPNADFAAILVCNSADAACPLVPGAEARFPIKYEDPKVSDDKGDEAQAAAYEGRFQQICEEMLWVMARVAEATAGAEA